MFSCLFHSGVLISQSLRGLERFAGVSCYLPIQHGVVSACAIDIIVHLFALFDIVNVARIVQYRLVLRALRSDLT